MGFIPKSGLLLIEGKIMNSNKNFPQIADNKEQKGASLVEYALLIALIAVIAIVAIRGLGARVSANLSNVTSELAGTTN